MSARPYGSKARHCWTTRDDFMTAIGVVNADVKISRTGVRFSTRYREVAIRIRSMARSTGAHVLDTVTDEGLYVISVKGFYQSSKVTT